MSTPFSSLTIGKLALPTNVIQGPLAGYSCAPFRSLLWQHGAPAYTCTEMLSATDLACRAEQPLRYVYRDPCERLLCYQLSSHDPEPLKRAASIVTKAGADLIDLNCGCPVHKIRHKSAGSKLLQTPEKMYALLRAIKENTSLPVTVKIRVSAPLEDHCTHSVVDAVQAAGVDAIIVHGRHWTQRYDVPVNLDAIREVVSFARVPVIANGDICDADSLQRVFALTGCHGVMIARASVGDPWLFARLRDNTVAMPSLAEVADAFCRHVAGLVSLEGERNAVFQSRSLAKYYAKHLQGDVSEFVGAVQQTTDLQALYALIQERYNCAR